MFTKYKIYLQETRIVQHLHYVSNNNQFVRWYFQPIIKCMGEFGSDLFAWHLHNVSKRLH